MLLFLSKCWAEYALKNKQWRKACSQILFLCVGYVFMCEKHQGNTYSQHNHYCLLHSAKHPPPPKKKEEKKEEVNNKACIQSFAQQRISTHKQTMHELCTYQVMCTDFFALIRTAGTSKQKRPEKMHRVCRQPIALFRQSYTELEIIKWFQHKLYQCACAEKLQRL